MQKIKNMLNYSFWETETYFSDIDLIVIGSGIVGLSSAISYIEKYKNAKVVILERGFLPTGASTKNAGFACFGSVSELISDIDKTSYETVMQTVEMRIKGLEILRSRLGDKNINFKKHGGFELFDDVTKFEKCAQKISELNKDIDKLTKVKNTYSLKPKMISNFGFAKIKGIIKNSEEGQINTGEMMKSLMQYATNKGILILNNIKVSAINDNKNLVSLETNVGKFHSKKVIVATNGFANELLKIKDVNPARAQVLVTKPISNLKIKGTFHYNEGFVYFRNIGDRILLGGGRDLDIKTETTTNFDLNDKIQQYLLNFLKTTILPNQKVEIDQRWTGIMGVGSEKKPIIKSVSENVVCAIRMGGMGVAIGSLVGKQAVNEL